MPVSKKVLSFLKPQTKSLELNQNPEQEKAIRHRQGPMMVLAGPGSGKTYTLTQRVYYLIHTYGISPNQILVITFTKQAALEMEKRFLSMDPNSSVYFATFHALFYRILRGVDRYKGISLCDDIEKKEYLKNAYHRLEFAKQNPNLLKDAEMCDALLKEISLFKAKQGMKETESFISSCVPEKVFFDLYQVYLEELRYHGKIDYDDMVILCLQELKKDPALLALLHNRFRYFLVDEFQDISPHQFEIIRLLSQETNNLFVVGDDDQSIYGFRGSSPRIMLEFEKYYPDVTKVQLKYNYRSCPEITEAALKVIRENKLRFRKKILNQSIGKGKVYLLGFGNEESEYMKMATMIEKDKKAGKSVAILCRTGKSFSDIQIVLSRFHLAGNRTFKEKGDLLSSMIEDLEAYYLLSKGEFGRREFMKVMNKPLRYIPREAIPEQVSFSKLKSIRTLRLDVKNRIDILERQCKLLGTLPPKAFLTYLLKSMGYEAYLKEYGKKLEISPATIRKYEKALAGAAESFTQLEDYMEYLKKDGLVTGLGGSKSSGGKEQTEISLLTMHAAKGLEFDVVYIPDCAEGNIPHHRCKGEDGIEEERRLFYVAMTRAKEKICIFYPEAKDSAGKKPSRFLNVLKSGDLC